MNSLSVMAYKDITDRKPSYFFDLQDETSASLFFLLLVYNFNSFAPDCLQMPPVKRSVNIELYN